VGLVVTGISQNGDISGLEPPSRRPGSRSIRFQLIAPTTRTQGAASSMGLADRLDDRRRQGTGVPRHHSGVPTRAATA